MSTRLSPHWRLALLGLVMLVVRLAIVAGSPDLDSDAYGHFRSARALLRDPSDLNAHWVWLPLYHYVVWVLLQLNVSYTGLRVVNAALQTLAPFMLFDYVSRRDGTPNEWNRGVAFVSAVALTIAPLANRMATSAQAETCFSGLVLVSAWAIERRRFVWAGVLLSAACLVRYEAWGALVALGVYWGISRGKGFGVAAVAVPAATVIGWILLRHHVDHEWFAFARQTQSFSSGLRAWRGMHPLVDALFLPIVVPFIVFGPALLWLPFGIRSAARLSWLIPTGILAFLLASYAGRGAPGLDRYYTALTPFACVLIAEGAYRVPSVWHRFTQRAAIGFAIATLSLTSVGYLAWGIYRANTRAVELRRWEHEVSRS